MAFNANHHANYAQRCEDWARGFRNLLEEVGRLRDIRQHQASNGTHADYTDTAKVTKAELETLSTLMDHFRRWETGDNTVPVTNKRSMWVPFVQ